MVLDFTPSLLAAQPLTTNAPFLSVKSVDGEKDSSDLSGRFNSGAAALWDRIISWRDLLAFFLLINAIHLGIATKQQSSATAVDACAVNSYLIIFLEMVTFAILCTSSIIRSVNSFSIMAETGLGLVYVIVATVLASASGPHRWALKLGEADICSAAANAHANSVYWLADVLGTGSVVAIVISVYAKPFIRSSPILSCAVLAILAIVVQLTVFDLWLVPEISTVWQTIETNGTALDADIKTIADRLGSIETIFNITI